MRSRRRAVLALGLLLLAASSAPAVAQGGASRSPALLTRSVTVSGAGAAWTTVRLAEPLDLRRETAPRVRISHPSRFDALVLLRVAPGSGAPGVAVVGLPDETGPSSAYAYLGTDNGDLVTGTPVFLERVLPPGTYRLLLLSRGANTVTIDLPGVRRGSTRVVTSAATTYVRQLEAASGVPGTAVAPTATAATTFTSRTRGLQVGMAWVRSTSAARRAHSCLREDPDAVDERLAPTPYCLAMAGINDLEPGADRADRYQSFFQPVAGTWQSKISVAAAGAASELGALSLQVDLGAGYPRE